MSADALVVEFEVAAVAHHEFDTWTTRCASWWPARHTISGDPSAIVFEPRVGGRIFERGVDGAEHDWGRVVEWLPPQLLRYQWHLFFTPEEATEIEITFSESNGRTAVRLEQRGFDALGAAGPPRRERTGTVWASLVEQFRAALEPGQVAG